MLLTERPRRNRKNENIRRLLAENHLKASDLVAPLFVMDGENKREEISSLPGQYRLGIGMLLEEVHTLEKRGILAVALFPAIDSQRKNNQASEALNPDGVYLKAISQVKKNFPRTQIISDVALDPYSSDGHDGLFDPETGEIVNDESVQILCKMASLQARAGSDLIGPSDMMDGRVGAIRRALDKDGFKNTSILSYTTKYASAFYHPFRDALDSAPKGDKKTYQMNPANIREALREARLDQAEGADILMVKPALAYLDVIKSIKEETALPVAAYNVSGEYAMVKAAAAAGWIDEKKAILEILLSIKRAGADTILTYFAKDAATILDQCAK